MAKTFELNPGFPSGAAKVLEARGKRIKEKELNFNYKRYAYIYLTSAPSAPEAPKDSDGDSISLFDLYEKKGLTIGIPPSGGHLSLYDIENSSCLKETKCEEKNVYAKNDTMPLQSISSIFPHVGFIIQFEARRSVIA